MEKVICGLVKQLYPKKELGEKNPKLTGTGTGSLYQELRSMGMEMDAGTINKIFKDAFKNCSDSVDSTSPKN